MGKLDGKVTIVTGAARGLGRAYALRMAQLGAKVVVTDLNLHAFEEFEGDRHQANGRTTMDEIIAGGGEALGFEFDISKREGMVEAVESTASAWGRIDILIANAGGGTGGSAGSASSAASDLDVELMTRGMELNYFGTVHSCTAVAPYMKEQRSGKIVTVSSTYGVRPPSALAHYASSKAAVMAYTRALALDLAPHGINVNCIAPGYVPTGRVRARSLTLGNSPEAAGASIPLQRIASTTDLSNAMEFFVTDLSDYVTGQVLAVDGGATIAESARKPSGK